MDVLVLKYSQIIDVCPFFLYFLSITLDSSVHFSAATLMYSSALQAKALALFGSEDSSLIVILSVGLECKMSSGMWQVLPVFLFASHRLWNVAGFTLSCKFSDFSLEACSLEKFSSCDKTLISLDCDGVDETDAR